MALYPLAKRVTWWPQLVMGFTFGFGAPMGYAAGTGPIVAAGLALYAAAIAWDLGFDTIYGFQDIEDDLLAGHQKHLPAFRACAPAGSWAYATLRPWRCLRPPAGWPAWAFGSGPLWHSPATLLAWQVARLNTSDPRLLPAPVPPKSGNRAGHRRRYPRRPPMTAITPAGQPPRTLHPGQHHTGPPRFRA